MPRRARVLICPPTHYRVDYEINPWMNLKRQPDPALALRQWDDLKRLLGRYADTVEVVPVPGAPDMVFTANAGFVHGRRVIVSRFRHAQRRVEEPYFRAWFERDGFAIVDWPQEICFEGNGDALQQPDGDTIWFGHGFRSDYAACARLRTLFPDEVVPLQLVSPTFYHLDTCLCPLPGGAVMYYPAAFDAGSRLELYRRLQPAQRIEVSAEDAHAFACNALVLGTTVITNHVSAALRGRLERFGLDVVQCGVDQFMRAGGAVKCLTLVLEPQGEAAA